MRYADNDQNADLTRILREELGRRRMSRQTLADAARISISTLEKALNGSRPLTTASIVRLEGVLGRSLRPTTFKVASHPELGGYSREAVAWLEGDYLTLRPSFEIKNAVYGYRIQIAWNETISALSFREADRIDAPFAQKGLVSMPNKSGQIYLYTNEEGQMRLAILGRPQITGEIYGLLTTLTTGAGNLLTPVAVPLALIPWTMISDPKLGRIVGTDSQHPAYQGYLDKVISGGFVKLIS